MAPRLAVLHHYREIVVLGQSCAADQAFDPSQGQGLLMCFWVQAATGRFPRWLWRGYDFPCKGWLDSHRRHRAVCPRSGLLRIRATPTEMTLARVCRE